MAGRGAAAAARGPKRTKRTKRGLYLGRRPQCSKRQNAQNAGIAGPPAASKRQNAKTPKRTHRADNMIHESEWCWDAAEEAWGVRGEAWSGRVWALKKRTRYSPT